MHTLSNKMLLLTINTLQLKAVAHTHTLPPPPHTNDHTERHSPSLWPVLPRPRSGCQSVLQEPPPAAASASRWPQPSEAGSSAGAPELKGRNGLNINVTGKLKARCYRRRSHRCSLAPAPSAGIGPLRASGGASHWGLEEKQQQVKQRQKEEEETFNIAFIFLFYAMVEMLMFLGTFRYWEMEACCRKYPLIPNVQKRWLYEEIFFRGLCRKH